MAGEGEGEFRTYGEAVAEVRRLRGEVRRRDHRESFADHATAAGGMTRAAARDLFDLSGYEPYEETMSSFEKAKMLEDGRRSRPHMFGDAAVPGPPPAAGANYGRIGASNDAAASAARRARLEELVAGDRGANGKL